MATKVGYLIPEFPGQTHIWMWREIEWMRRWGVPLQIFSTRRPGSRDAARHAFAEQARQETIYLWPPGFAQAIGSTLWAAARHPAGVLRCLWLCFTLPIEGRPRWRHLLPLLLPAFILARQCRRLGVTRLHAHTCAAGAVLCMMCKRLIGIPFSLTLNANIEWWGGAMAEKFADAEFTIAITRWLLEQMRSQFPQLRADQALLGRIGVDTQRWTPVTDSPPSNGEARVVTVGRLHSSKGHDVLVQAIHLLRRDGRNVTLRLLGDGPERTALESQVVAAGLGDHVTFAGSVSEDQVIQQLRSADLFVLASHAEPLGVVYMEAMALQVATIGTAAGGVAEIITHGDDGLLVPPRDPRALARAIAQLLDDPALRRRLAERGRQTIVERFDSRLGAQTLYERMFGHPPPQERPSA